MRTLYRRYLQFIYRSKLFSQETKARMIYLTRHAFRYGVPIDCSSVPTLRYSVEEALKRGQRTLELVENLQVSPCCCEIKETQGMETTLSSDVDWFHTHYEEEQILDHDFFGVYQDLEEEEEEEEKLGKLEGEVLARALLTRLVTNVVHFTFQRHDRKVFVRAVRRNELKGISSPFISVDKCIHILNRELGTCFYTKVLKTSD